MKGQLVKIRLDQTTCLQLTHLFEEPAEGAAFAAGAFMAHYNALVEGVLTQFNRGELEAIKTYFRGKSLDDLGYTLIPDLEQYMERHERGRAWNGRGAGIIRKLKWLTYMELLVLLVWGYSQWNNTPFRGKERGER